MNANVPLELVAEKIGECVDFVRINLQQGTLLVDGLPVRMMCGNIIIP